MTRQEFTDYMTAFEKRLDARFAQIDGRFAQVDGRFAQVDERFARIDEHFAQIDRRFAQVDGRLAQVDGRLAQVDGRLADLDGRVTESEKRLAESGGHFARLEARIDDLKHSMNVQFEDVRRDISFSFEAVQGLREVTDRRFEDQRAEHREQISLMHDVLHHVRGRVDRIERRPRTPRKRRS